MVIKILNVIYIEIEKEPRSWTLNIKVWVVDGEVTKYVHI